MKGCGCDGSGSRQRSCTEDYPSSLRLLQTCRRVSDTPDPEMAAFAIDADSPGTCPEGSSQAQTSEVVVGQAYA